MVEPEGTPSGASAPIPARSLKLLGKSEAPDGFVAAFPAWPYSVQDGRILFTTRRKVRGEWEETVAIVCDFQAQIIHDIQTEEGGRAFLIRGQTAPSENSDGFEFEFEITAEQYSDERALKAAFVRAAGAKAPVRKGMSGHLPAAISLLSADVSRSKRFNRTGWHDDHFLIPGREAADTSIALPRKLPYSINSEAELSKGQEAFESLLQAQRSEAASVAATAFFQAPLARLAGWRNERSCLFVAGRTGSLKSSWTQTMMSVYGEDFLNDDQLIKFGEGATRVAIMIFASHAHDMPLLLDNYKPNTGGGAKDFVNVIHNILEGGDKDRGTQNATLRDSKPIFCWPVVTGEDVPDSDAAALARVLVVSFAWRSGEENPHLTNAQNLSPHLNALGGAWLSWLETEDGHAAAKKAASMFRERRATWSSHLRSIRSDMVNVSRVASNLATNEMTWFVMMMCPALKAICQQFKAAHHDGLLEVAGQMAMHTAESLEATRYLSALRVLLATNRVVLQSRYNDRIIDNNQVMGGWQDDNGAYLLPEVIHKEIMNLLRDSGGLNNVSTQTLYKQLDSLGAIAKRGKDTVTRSERIHNKPHRVLHLSLAAIEGETDANDEPTTDTQGGDA